MTDQKKMEDEVFEQDISEEEIKAVNGGISCEVPMINQLRKCLEPQRILIFGGNTCQAPMRETEIRLRCGAQERSYIPPELQQQKK